MDYIWNIHMWINCSMLVGCCNGSAFIVFLITFWVKKKERPCPFHHKSVATQCQVPCRVIQVYSFTTACLSSPWPLKLNETTLTCLCVKDNLELYHKDFCKIFIKLKGKDVAPYEFKITNWECMSETAAPPHGVRKRLPSFPPPQARGIRGIELYTETKTDIVFCSHK